MGRKQILTSELKTTNLFKIFCRNHIYYKNLLYIPYNINGVTFGHPSSNDTRFQAIHSIAQSRTSINLRTLRCLKHSAIKFCPIIAKQPRFAQNISRPSHTHIACTHFGVIEMTFRPMTDALMGE